MPVSCMELVLFIHWAPTKAPGKLGRLAGTFPWNIHPIRPMMVMAYNLHSFGKCRGYELSYRRRKQLMLVAVFADNNASAAVLVLCAHRMPF